MEAHALRPVPLGGKRIGPLRRLASDDGLVAAVRAHHPDAFEAIYDRYHRQILSFCRHMLGSREEAEDAVQHTFMAAYTDMASSDKPIQLRPWLYTIARNHCLSLLRARREQATLEEVEPAVEGLSAQVQRRADLRDMLRDLARLPDDQRAALVLAELGALSHDEIANVLGCSREKVKALVFQARSSLAASRAARETPCEEIREQLATLTGGSLRRTHLRRHLRECPGCREFRAEVKRQRTAMAVLLPVMPSAALKSGALGAIGLGHAGGAAAGGAAAGTGGASGLAAILANAGAAKLVVAAAVVAGGAGGTVAAVEAIDHDKPAGQRPATSPGSRGGQGPAGGAGGGQSFSPSRAHGMQGLGRIHGGVANGRNLRGRRGRSQTAPGRAGTAPGRAGTSPGRAGTSPGRAGTIPGRSGISPGRSGTQGSRSGAGSGSQITGTSRSQSAGGGSGVARALGQSQVEDLVPAPAP